MIDAATQQMAAGAVKDALAQLWPYMTAQATLWVGRGSVFLARGCCGSDVAVAFWLRVALAWLWQCLSRSGWLWLNCGGLAVAWLWLGCGSAVAVFFELGVALAQLWQWFSCSRWL